MEKIVLNVRSQWFLVNYSNLFDTKFLRNVYKFYSKQFWPIRFYESRKNRLLQELFLISCYMISCESPVYIELTPCAHARWVIYSDF